MSIKTALVLPYLLMVGALIRLADAADAQPLRLELVSLKHGHNEASFGSDPERFAETPVARAAARAGVDLWLPQHPALICSYRQKRMFYLFYNEVAEVPEGRYLIQRVKRTWIDHLPFGDPNPRTDYLVEAIKSQNGRSKRPDQHFGSYGIREHPRREMIKEFEVGIGTVPGIAKGDDWPFDAGKLYHRIQDYGPDSDVYESVEFEQSLTWTLSLTFDAGGSYELRCPELEIDVKWKVPALPEDAEEFPPIDPPPIDDADLVLQEGIGVLGLVVGRSTLTDARARLGNPLKTVRQPAAANYDFPAGLTLNIPDGGEINTIMTRAGFAGETSRGVRHGDARSKVEHLYGKPSGDSARSMSYDDVIFWFDAEGLVNKIVIWKRPTIRR